MFRRGSARWPFGAALLLLAVPLSAEAEDPRVAAIVGLIQGGRAADAVARADALIAQFAAAQQAPGVAYFCNRDRGGVANMMAASRGGAKVDLAPEAWCEALFAKGFALTELKRFAEAGKALEQAIAMDPTNPHFRNQLGDVLRLRGDGLGAAVQYQRAFALSSVEEGEATGAMAVRALRGLAMVAEARGDLTAARGYYERLLERDSSDVEARAKLAEIVRRQSLVPGH